MQVEESSRELQSLSASLEPVRVGVPRFDAEHVRLAELLQGATLAAHDRANPQLLRESLASIFGYALMHFSEEENAMAEVGYAGLAEHRLEHHKILERLQWQLNRYDVNPYGVALDVVGMLEAWLHEHIACFDVLYERDLRKP